MKRKQRIKDTSPSAKYKNLSNKISFSQQIDIRAGKMTFGQRIELGRLFQSNVSEVEKFEGVFEILHGKKPKTIQYAGLMDYFNEIVDGLNFWIQTEAIMLHYEPSNEELSAGIKELSEKIGEFGTVKALAKSYGKDPDDIFKWEYSKVFGILYTDLEEYKYQKRFNKIISNKK